MAHFLLRDYNILPKQELHWSLWVEATTPCQKLLGLPGCTSCAQPAARPRPPGRVLGVAASPKKNLQKDHINMRMLQSMISGIPLVLSLGARMSDHVNIKILQNMSSGIPLVLSLGARMSDPDVYVAFWAPTKEQLNITLSLGFIAATVKEP